MIKRIALLAAFAFLVPSLAMAGTLSFTTSGIHSAPGPIALTATSYSVADVSLPVGNYHYFRAFARPLCTTGVPEPNAVLLLGLGALVLMGFGFVSRKTINA